MSTTADDLVHEEWNNTLKYLKESSVDEILEGGLEIKRVQHLSSTGYNDNWGTNDFIIVLTTGGPHIEVSTLGRLSVSWYNHYEDQVTGDVKDKLDRIFDRLQSLHG